MERYVERMRRRKMLGGKRTVAGVPEQDRGGHKAGQSRTATLHLTSASKALAIRCVRRLEGRSTATRWFMHH